MFDTSRYTIGWVCAIPPELVAARLHLDVEHDHDKYEAAPNDSNTYIFGSIGKHDVVIATLPRGEYGVSSAASVARDLIRSFTNVRIRLMVGIGGGAPLVERDEKKAQDVRLGDVVVSTPGNGTGGVCQYDHGKALQGQGFQVTGHLNSPPRSLLAAVTILGTDFDLNGNTIEEDVAAMIRNRPRLRRLYQRPDILTDRLYESSFIHPDDDEICPKCCGEKAQLIQRKLREEDEDKVVIHYGLIASASTLMRDALLRDTFAEHFGVICFEMEAAGLMNQLPFLIIRGICDYSDSHKSKEWQGFAAMTAANYAKKLLSRLAPSRVGAEQKLSALREISDGMKDVSNKVDQLSSRLQKDATRALHNDIEQWLTPPDQSTNHNSALELRHEGTGVWIFGNDNFKEWYEGVFPLLWLHGISGCGKTVLTSTIIEYLRNTNKDQGHVLYFYFDTQDVHKQGLDSALRSLIKQLCFAQQSSYGHLIERLYWTCQEGTSQPTTSQLRHCFQQMCKDESITIVLDALDEHTDRETAREELLNWIKDTSLTHNIRVIVTSRPAYDIKVSLTAWNTSKAILPIQAASVNEDMRAFVRSKIHHDTYGLQRWRSHPDVQLEIENNLLRKADGMFRWVVCQLDVLRHCCKRQTLQSALTSLPEGLDETYARILRQITETHRADAIRLLQFLTYSERPLTLEEAVDALNVNPEATITFEERNREPVPEEIAKYCRSLTQITNRQVISKSGRWKTVTEIQLAHPSVREYLRSTRLDPTFGANFRESRARSRIVQVSLAYLYQASQSREESNHKTQFPLEQFAVRHWMDHASVVETEENSIIDWVDKLFTTERFCEYWLASYDPSGSADTLCALYYASLGGLRVSVRRLVEKGINVNTRGGMYGNALQAAAFGGHVEVVKLLLEKGANVNAEGGVYGHALQAASEGAHVEIVTTLLDWGADANARGGEHGSALCAASRGGHRRIVQVLLEKGADFAGRNFGRRDRGDNSAICAASSRGHVEIVKLLLDNGANVDTQSGKFHNSNALYAASAQGHVEIVKLLLGRGASANALGGTNGYDTALNAASARGHTEIVRLLLDMHARPNMRVGKYGADSVLRTASANGHFDIVEMLLDKGAEVNEWVDYGSALSAASGGGHASIVRLLLDRGADVEEMSNDGRLCPVHAASIRGHTEIVKVLLDKGAFVNADGDRLGHALRAASEHGHVEIVKLLLDKGTDIDGVRNVDYLSGAFRSASCNGHFDIVKLLIDKGCNVNVQEGTYGMESALHAASGEGHIDIVKLLLGNGADVNARGGYDGNYTVLQASCAGGHVEIVKLLLTEGAEFDGALHAAAFGGNFEIVKLLLDKGAEYHNALSAASYGGHSEIVRLLIHSGVDVNARDSAYCNAVYAASERGHTEVVDLLLANHASAEMEGGEFGHPLQAASARGYVEVVRLLLDNGAAVNAVGGKYGNALQAAARGGHTAIVKLLLAEGADVNIEGGTCHNALQAASTGGHMDIVKLLLDRDADANANEGSALQDAVNGGHAGILKLLLAHDVRFDHHLALYNASLRGNVGIVQQLLDTRTDVNLDGHYRDSGSSDNALYAASRHNFKGIVRLLLDKGFDVNMKGGDSNNDTALCAASGQGYTEIVKLLLEKGADVDMKGGWDGKQSALLHASVEGHYDIVDLLLQKGAADGANEDGYCTALEVALRQGYTDVAELLVAKHATVGS